MFSTRMEASDGGRRVAFRRGLSLNVPETVLSGVLSPWVFAVDQASGARPCRHGALMHSKLK